MRWTDLLPLCCADGCPLAGQHKHPLDHQIELLDSPAKYIYVQGGFGSTKTLIACIKVFRTMIGLPGSRWLIGRRTLPKLHDSTQRVFMEVLNRSGLEGVRSYENRGLWAHHLVFPNGSEVFFRPTKDLGNFLGPEYSGFLIDEAQEEPEGTFTSLQSRLRLPLAKKYLCGMLLSNPPNKKHWLFKHFGDKPGVQVKEQLVDGLKIQTKYQFSKWSTRWNPHVGRQYIADLITTHGEEVANRVLDGDYGFSHDGTPVYMPPFSHNKHVGEPQYSPAITLIRSWDFGRRHPAVTFHQIYYCAKGQLHWSILGEVSDQNDIEVDGLAKVVLAYTKATFPFSPPYLIKDCGDRAGMNKTDQGPGPITKLGKAPYYLRFRYRTCEINTGLDTIAEFLKKPVCACGLMPIMVHRRCGAVVDGFAGGYHYPEATGGRAPADKPRKDGHFDDVMDSVRYGLENYVRPAMKGPLALTEIMSNDYNEPVEYSDPNAWMGA